MNIYDNTIEIEVSRNQTYMYTQFCGIDFIKGYFQSRHKAIENLRRRRLSGASQESEMYLRNTLKKRYSGEVFDLQSMVSQRIISLQVLLSLALLPADGGHVPEDTVKWWVNRFVQRFETTKRLYDSYLASWKRATESCKNISLYAVLSYLCGRMYEKTMNYKYLNCMLKINDLLVYADKTGLAEDEIQFIALCLEQEVRWVEQICQESGIFSHGA